MEVFTWTQGVFLLIVYFALMWLLTVVFAGKFSTTKLSFLAADRSIGQWPAGFSIAATWIWAPALFVAAQKAYTQGWVGAFWFTVPNIACLIIFAHFAARIREKMPDGFTLSGYMLKRYSARVHNLYTLQLVGLSACSFAVQLLAGGVVVSGLTGIPFLTVTIILSFIALSYSWFAGIKASIVTDYAQMVFIALVGFIVVPWVVMESGGMSTVIAGLAGKSGTFTNLFAGDGLSVFWAFGIPVTVGLLSGPFGDQSFWQRAYSVKQNEVKGAFIKASVIFGIVPVLMAFLGFAAAGAGLSVKDAQLVNLETVLYWLPKWVVVPFTFMLLSGLVSTLDSNLCAVSSIAGHDFFERSGRDSSGMMSFARWVMVGFCVGAVLIANIPGMKILYLFLFYGTLRASTLLPTIITLLSDRVNEKGVFWGILMSISFGLPMFAYAKFTGNVPWIVIGSLFTVLCSGIVTLVMSREKAVYAS